MYWACADVFTLAANLGPGTLLPNAQAMRAHLQQLFGVMRQRALAAGITPEDTTDAMYALMALMDELLVQTHWPGQFEWRANPLQLQHFQENTAGENFFRRAHALLGQPHRAHVLQVYFFVLALGFQGHYAVSGGAGLAPVYDQIASAVGQYLPPSDALSPHGEPPDVGGNLLRRDAPLVRVSLALCISAAMIFLLLRAALSFQLGSVTQSMRDYATAPAPPGKP
jgi:type VI secretion system protein ImpK